MYGCNEHAFCNLRSVLGATVIKRSGVIGISGKVRGRVAKDVQNEMAFTAVHFSSKCHNLKRALSTLRYSKRYFIFRVQTGDQMYFLKNENHVHQFQKSTFIAELFKTKAFVIYFIL